MKKSSIKKNRFLAVLLMAALVAVFPAGVTEVSASSIKTDEETWAIYWYICGSDLETDGGCATKDICEMWEVELPDNATVVIQTGGSEEWWLNTVDSDNMYRLEYTGEDLNVVERVKNASMGDPNTLVDFLEFCENNYPADKKMLIFWDHGGGSGSGVCFDELFDDDGLTLEELQLALETVYGEGDPLNPSFDIIGFDACLMATIDVASVCYGYADYLVASQEYEPGIGWDYTGIMNAIAMNPGITGEELGIAICDTYFAACKKSTVASMATLSVLSLANIAPVVYVIDSVGQMGVAIALDYSPSTFFASYGRGARSAEYYSDSGPEMVDLVDLVENNSALFGFINDYMTSAMENFVVYNVTGSYRSNSHGVSVYFPYKMNDEHYENFYHATASQGFLYMYEMLMWGELNAMAPGYFNNLSAPEIRDWRFYDPDDDDDDWYWDWDDDYEQLSGRDWDDVDESVIENGFTFEDMDEYGLEDWPIDIIGEDGFTYAVLDIGPEAAALLQRVTFMLAWYSDDGEEILMLGEDFDIDCDWEEGFFLDNFRGVWGAIDDNIVMMEVLSVTDDYILYQVPILLNSRLCDLTVAYMWETGKYVMLTATPVNENGMPSKEQLVITSGDEITTLVAYFGEDAEDYIEMGTLTVTAKTSFHEVDLPDGNYAFMYVMTDYKNNSYLSDLINVIIEDRDVYMAEFE